MPASRVASHAHFGRDATKTLSRSSLRIAEMPTGKATGSARLCAGAAHVAPKTRFCSSGPWSVQNAAECPIEWAYSRFSGALRQPFPSGAACQTPSTVARALKAAGQVRDLPGGPGVRAR
jgi:hypothetical protein